MREGDLVVFNSYACRSWPHDYTRREAAILVRPPEDPDRSDLALVLRRGRTELIHLRFLEVLREA